jgi:hypothetical protein
MKHSKGAMYVIVPMFAIQLQKHIHCHKLGLALSVKKYVEINRWGIHLENLETKGLRAGLM